MSTSVTGSKQKKADEEVVIKYIKDDLFAKVKFIYGEEEDLKVGGKIYDDYKKKCKDRIGGSGLSTDNHDMYLEGSLDISHDQALAETGSSSKKECGVHCDAE